MPQIFDPKHGMSNHGFWHAVSCWGLDRGFSSNSGLFRPAAEEALLDREAEVPLTPAGDKVASWLEGVIWIFCTCSGFLALFPTARQVHRTTEGGQCGWAT